MKALLPLLIGLVHLGGFGLFLVGILDSSFLFMPLGNDLLMLVLTAAHPAWMVWYAAMATLGSAAGCAIIDVISRKGGEEGLSRVLPERRIEYVKRRVSDHAAWALATAALLPPPFPFTPLVAAAAALQFPRWRLFAVLISARMLRFCIVGLLALAFGRHILTLAKEPVVQYSMVGLLLLFIVGSTASIWGWVKRSRHVEATAAG